MQIGGRADVQISGTLSEDVHTFRIYRSTAGTSLAGPPTQRYLTVGDGGGSDADNEDDGRGVGDAMIKGARSDFPPLSTIQFDFTTVGTDEARDGQPGAVARASPPTHHDIPHAAQYWTVGSGGD
ncbi:hypothetical protein ElyMa_005624500 [Elysia marginata]|uniref:Uncharacterized protein n=1 Tax=Elysia marginata TaxID=1093978 RepID=A0AAV4F733_9GAST|nr:hypothetical protein ElyMa_005624500 [Elysia marginata]